MTKLMMIQLCRLLFNISFNTNGKKNSLYDRALIQLAVLKFVYGSYLSIYTEREFTFCISKHIAA